MRKRTKPVKFPSFGGVGRLLLGLVAASVGFLLLACSAQVGDGIRRGLTICTTVVIPSLFPFMVLAGFLSRSPACQVLALPLSPITTRLLRLPADMGTVVLMSFLGGYPVGAHLLSSLLEQGRIDRRTASRMLCFCVNAGPSFLISAVGVALYASPRIGFSLLAAQVLSALTLGMILSLRERAKPVSLQRVYPPAPMALVQAVSSAATGMFTTCAFVVAFSGGITLLESTGLLPALSHFLAGHLPLVTLGEDFYSALITGGLEVTGGCVAAAALAPKTAFLLTAFLISFGGLSILCQVASSFPTGAVDLKPMLLSRLANALLTTAIAYPLYEKFCRGMAVYGNPNPPILVVSPRSAIVALCMIGMCSIVLLSLSVLSLHPQKSPTDLTQL